MISVGCFLCLQASPNLNPTNPFWKAIQFVSESAQNLQLVRQSFITDQRSKRMSSWLPWDEIRLMNENDSSHNHVRKAFVMLNCSRALRPHRSYDAKFFVMKTRSLFHQAARINAIGSKFLESLLGSKVNF